MIDRNNMQRVINIAGAANAAGKAARAGLLALMLAGFSLPVVAQTVEIAPETVVATVDGAEIKQADVEFVMQDLAEDLARVPENERRQVAIDILIEMSLLSSAAKAEGLDDTEAFRRQTKFLIARTLRNLYFEQKITNTVTDSEIKARFEQELEGVEAEDEIRARHILVNEEAEANAIIQELLAGGDFATLAQEKSTGPSGPNGGDLGFFGKGQMVPEFEAAAFALEQGAFTETPVKTQFGWHVIKVEEKRKRPLPKLEDVQEQIRQLLVRERYAATLEKLRESADVVVSTASDGGDANSNDN